MGGWANLSEPHFIGEDAIFTTTPKVRQPVQASELKIFELAASGHNVIRVALDLVERRSLVAWIVLALERELCFRLPCSERDYLFLGCLSDIIVRFPSTSFIAEVAPLDVIFWVTRAVFALRNDSLDLLPIFVLFAFAFLVEKKLFLLFGGYLRVIDTSFPLLVGLDVIVNALETFKAF